MSKKRKPGEPEPISAALETLAGTLIDYSLDLLAESGDLPVTLAVEDEAGNHTLLSFDDEDFEECLIEVHDRLRRAARGEDALEGLKARPERYAVAYDGCVDEGRGEGYVSALIVEYGERGLSSGYSLYLLYDHPGKPQKFVWTDPAPAGEGELLV